MAKIYLNVVAHSRRSIAREEARGALNWYAGMTRYDAATALPRLIAALELLVIDNPEHYGSKSDIRGAATMWTGEFKR